MNFTQNLFIFDQTPTLNRPLQLISFSILCCINELVKIIGFFAIDRHHFVWFDWTNYYYIIIKMYPGFCAVLKKLIPGISWIFVVFPAFQQKLDML